MNYIIDDIFRELCRQISLEDKSLDEWAEIESDDMFQEGKWVGGFDAIEMEFCFSIYDNDVEYCFQITLDDVHKIVNGDMNSIEIVKV